MPKRAEQVDQKSTTACGACSLMVAVCWRLSVEDIVLVGLEIELVIG